MTYWLDLFTGATWREFLDAGGRVSGFRKRQMKRAKSVKKGDIFICYVTGVQRWVGALRVVGPSTDSSDIWSVDEFPVRFEVETILALDPEFGVPMAHLEGKVCFYEGPEDKGKYKGFIRTSLNRFADQGDGEAIYEMVKKAKSTPVRRAVDPKKLARLPTYKVQRKKGRKTVEAVVSIPDSDEEEVAAPVASPTEANPTPVPSTRHVEIQYNLAKLGAEMGLDVWVARNDRAKVYCDKTLGGSLASSTSFR